MRLTAVVGSLLLCATVFAQPSAPLDYFPALMDTLVGGHYQAARAICSDLEMAFPGDPAVYYARASVDYAHMIDMEDTLGRGEFMALCDSCIQICEDRKPTPTEGGAVLSYLRGSALAIKGLLMNHEGKTLPALKTLIKAKNAFDAAIEEDPGFYDAYLGRGAYRYAVATHASLLKWLPFIPSRKSGWQDLWIAASRSKFSQSTALSSIVWHAMDEGDFATADSIIQSQLERFPGCRNFLWPKLAMYERQDRLAEAEQAAQELLGLYLQHPDNNGYEPIGLYWRMMKCADGLNRPEDAKTYARSGLDTYRTAEVALRRADKLREMQARLSNP